MAETKGEFQTRPPHGNNIRTHKYGINYSFQAVVNFIESEPSRVADNTGNMAFSTQLSGGPGVKREEDPLSLQHCLSLG